MALICREYFRVIFGDSFVVRPVTVCRSAERWSLILLRLI